MKIERGNPKATAEAIFKIARYGAASVAAHPWEHSFARDPHGHGVVLLELLKTNVGDQIMDGG